MEDVHFGQAIVSMWKRCFDYKGISSKKEYWYPVILQVMITAVAVALVFLMQTVEAGTPYTVVLVIFIVLVTYSVISFVPWLSLTLRRLRDTGKSGWWTVLLFIIGIGTMILLILFAVDNNSGAYGDEDFFDPGQNMNKEIYGPPEMFDDATDEEYFNPSDNEPATIYGPPNVLN